MSAACKYNTCRARPHLPRRPPARPTSSSDQVAPVAAQRGEPWLTCLAPDEMSALLDSSGFGRIEHVSQRDSISAALWDRSDTLHPIRLSMLARATIRR